MSDLAGWLTGVLGRAPGQLAEYERALTHGSHATATYERLEFLGDRVLGLVVAEWLFELYPTEPEGQLSKRLNALVTGAVCADVARGLHVRDHLRLGKQARDDGASDSDNVLGDVMEALIGAYLPRGRAGGRARSRFAGYGATVPRRDARPPQHPKSALQEWAAANQRRPPEYTVADRSGPHHAPRFTVTVSVGKGNDASAEGANKHEAETAAAATLLARLTEKATSRRSP